MRIRKLPSSIGSNPEAIRQIAETVNRAVDLIQPFGVSPTQTASFTVSEIYGVWPCDTSATAMTAFLPPANPHNGKIYRIKKKNGANTLTVDAADSETIDGTLTIAVTTTLTVVSDGAGWLSL